MAIKSALISVSDKSGLFEFARTRLVETAPMSVSMGGPDGSVVSNFVSAESRSL